jgi:hypothetical protein
MPTPNTAPSACSEETCTFFVGPLGLGEEGLVLVEALELPGELDEDVDDPVLGAEEQALSTSMASAADNARPLTRPRRVGVCTRPG